MTDRTHEGTSGEEGLIAARRAKAARVRERGENPFANDAKLDDRTWIRDLRGKFVTALVDPTAERYSPEMVAALVAEAGTGGEPKRIHVAGRITSRRGFGKATFLRLRDATDEIQLFAKQDVLGEGIALLEDIEVADHVEAEGTPMVTKTGELSLLVSSLRLLTKALRPLPDKWHGLTDVDTRYRRRYVDLVANPGVAAVFRARTLIIQGLRAFLDAHGFLEVETPTLHSIIGGAAARPFTTHHNTLDLDLFLRIAPELYLKRLLVGGLERVYEIGRCYRNEGISTRHNPEFTMLEFYQAYATYETLMDLTEEMLRFVDRHLGERMKAFGQGAQYETWVGERGFTFAEPFVRVPLVESIRTALAKSGLPSELLGEVEALVATNDESPAYHARVKERVAHWSAASERATKVEWFNLIKGIGTCEGRGEREFCAYEYLAEPYLAADYRSADGTKSVPVLIIDYPFEVSPLARRKDSNPALTDRFELFVESRELCNAFSELNDPDDQAARFRAQVEKKSRGAEETMDYDADYIRALEHGMPPAAGFGLGVDRLVMMLASQPSIRDVIAFPLLRPESVGA